MLSFFKIDFVIIITIRFIHDLLAEFGT